MAKIPLPAYGAAGVEIAACTTDVVSDSPGWIRAWSFFGLAAGATFLVVLPVGHTAALRSVSFVAALLAAAALWTAPSRRIIPVFTAFGVWLAGAALSLFSSRDVGASLQAIESEILRSALIFLIFYVLTRRLGALRIWVLATAIGFGVLSFAAIQSFFDHGLWRREYVPTLGDYATLAITVLPLLGSQLFFHRREWPTTLLVAAATALTMAAAYLTMSRAFWLVLICGLALGTALHFIRTGRMYKRSVLLLLLVSSTAVALAAAVAIQRDRSLLFVDDRKMIYSWAVAKIPEIPITGTGYGYETDRQWYADRMPGYGVYHPHNIVLSFLDQMGILGPLVLMAIFGAPAVALWRVLRSSTDEAGVAATCGLVLLAGVFVKNNLDYFFWKHNLWLFFAHLGAYFGHIDRSLLPAATNQVGFDGRIR